MTHQALLDWRYYFRVAFGVVFIWAALAKVGDLNGFANDIHNFRILPLAFENVFAMTLPWIELVAGVALIMNVAPRSGLIILGGLLVIFMGAILSAIIRNLDIDCGCFGTSDASQTGWTTLLRDVGFLVLALLGWPRKSARTHENLSPARSEA
jgi:uncharacterized membrane protein YphA (DoxX/SURF4 family)